MGTNADIPSLNVVPEITNSALPLHNYTTHHAVPIAPSGPSLSNILIGTTLTFATLLMFLGNLFALVAILNSRRLVRIPSYWYIINLTLIDFVWSITVMPLAIIWEFSDSWPFSARLCDVYNTLDIGLSTLGVYSILFITLDKYFYIRMPMWYDRVVKRRRVVMVIVLLWVCCIGGSVYTIRWNVAEETDAHELSCVFIMKDVYAIIASVFTFLLPFSLLMFQSLRILHITRTHLKRIGQIRRSVCGSSMTFDKTAEGRDLIRTSWRTIALTMAVVSVFTMMQAPYWVSVLVAAACDCIDRTWLDDNLAYLYYVNPLMNPALYLATDRRYRKAAKDLLCKILGPYRERSKKPTTSTRVSLIPSDSTAVQYMVETTPT